VAAAAQIQEGIASPMPDKGPGSKGGAKKPKGGGKAATGTTARKAGAKK
jgi:hypothetical protein